MTLTQQQIFDQVATHLFTQGHRAGIKIEGDFYCKYRAPNGKCAIGALIPNELYQPAWDTSNIPIRSLLSNLSNIFSKESADLLSILQSTHDDLYSWKSPQILKFLLSNIAEEYSLSPAILDTFPKDSFHG